MKLKVWGVPLHTSTEVLKKFKNSSLWPDCKASTVVIVGADTLVYAIGTKKLKDSKLYLVIETPIILRQMGIPLNGALYQGLGIYNKTTLKTKDPEPWVPNKELNTVQVMARNAKRIDGLVKLSKGKLLEASGNWLDNLNKVKDKEADKRKAAKEEVEEPVTLEERDE
jgi:hypothetical protein